MLRVFFLDVSAPSWLAALSGFEASISLRSGEMFELGMFLINLHLEDVIGFSKIGIFMGF